MCDRAVVCVSLFLPALDEESTIAEQEAMEVEADQKKELAELAKDGSLRH